jgi:hypothetical protein
MFASAILCGIGTQVSVQAGGARKLKIVRRPGSAAENQEKYVTKLCILSDLAPVPTV